MAYLRIQTGIFDPSLIGDKPKWYCRYLSPIQFKTYEDKSTLAAAIQFNQNLEASKYKSGGTRSGAEDDSPTDDSVASDADDNAQYSSHSSLNEDKFGNCGVDRLKADNIVVILVFSSGVRF